VASTLRDVREHNAAALINDALCEESLEASYVTEHVVAVEVGRTGPQDKPLARDLYVELRARELEFQPVTAAAQHQWDVRLDPRIIDHALLQAQLRAWLVLLQLPCQR
jgi:hypothetical protein